jgi:hypothetical protein
MLQGEEAIRRGVLLVEAGHRLKNYLGLHDGVAQSQGLDHCACLVCQGTREVLEGIREELPGVFLRSSELFNRLRPDG